MAIKKFSIIISRTFLLILGDKKTKATIQEVATLNSILPKFLVRLSNLSTLVGLPHHEERNTNEQSVAHNHASSSNAFKGVYKKRGEV